MKNYYAKKKEEAVETLSILTGDNVDNSKAGVRAALADVFKDGSTKSMATAVMAVSKWCWAHNECDEEDYKALVGKSAESNAAACVTADGHTDASHEHKDTAEAVPAQTAPAAK